MLYWSIYAIESLFGKASKLKPGKNETGPDPCSSKALLIKNISKRSSKIQLNFNKNLPLAWNLNNFSFFKIFTG